MNKKYLFLKILLILNVVFTMNVFSQQTEIPSITISEKTDEIKLSNQNITWSKVIPGKFITQPKETSFGFVSITDAKTITAITNDGKLYYEHSIPRLSNPNISVLHNDFLLLASDDNTIYLLNPSGSTIWTKQLSSKVISSAFSGRDGRFFILTEKNLICFGINGICKWEIPHNTNLSPKQNYEIFEFADGTIAIAGQNSITRFSPFGSFLENKNFSENITNATQIEGGIIITLSNKSLCLEISDNKIFEKWITQFDNSQIEIYSNQSKTKIIALSKYKTTAKIYYLDSDSGQIKKEFVISNINDPSTIKVTYTTDKIFIYTNTKGSFFTEDGNIIWTGLFPKEKQSSSFNYYYLSKDNHLIFCKKNWTIDAYRLFQDLNNNKSTAQNKRHLTYLDFYNTNSDFEVLYNYTLDSKLVSTETKETLLKGFYAEEEIEIISRLIQSNNVYIKSLNSSNFGTRTEKSIFQKNTKDFHQIISLTNLFGIDTFSNFTSSILTKEKDSTTILVTLEGIKQNGYDPDGKILSSLELLATKTNSKNTKIIYDICDSVYSICKLMGNKAFFDKGKAILTKFIYPNYSREVRDYASQTMTKIAKL